MWLSWQPPDLARRPSRVMGFAMPRVTAGGRPGRVPYIDNMFHAWSGFEPFSAEYSACVLGLCLRNDCDVVQGVTEPGGGVGGAEGALDPPPTFQCVCVWGGGGGGVGPIIFKQVKINSKYRERERGMFSSSLFVGLS